MPARMIFIEELANKELKGITPFLAIDVNDNLMSVVTIRGTLENKDKWINGIFHNANYFILHIVPVDGHRWYEGEDTVTAELVSKGPGLVKFRRYTATPAKVIAKIWAWIEAQKLNTSPTDVHNS